MLFSLAERTVDSGLSGVLNGTTPLWTVLIGYLWGTEKTLTSARIAGLALGFGGVLLILGRKADTNLARARPRAWPPRRATAWDTSTLDTISPARNFNDEFTANPPQCQTTQ